MPFKFSKRGNEDVEISAKDILGFSEDEIKEKFGSLDGLRSAVTEQSTTLEALKANLAALTEKITELGGKNNNNNNGGGEGGGEEEVDPSVRLSAAALNMGMENKIDSIKSKMRSAMVPNSNPPKLKYPYFEQFESEMEELTKKDPIASKTNPVYWENAYNIILGKNIDKITSGEIKTRQSFFLEGGGPNPVHGERVDPNKPSEVDIRQAAKFNIPVEKYMETKKKMTFV